jgi:hypothetical protein
MAFLQKIKGTISEKNLFILGIAIITITFLPYLFWGEDSHIRIHDNLDSNLVWVKMILDQGGIFNPPATIIEQPMDGLPYSSVYSSYDISFIFFKLFGIFWGYIFNKLLMALVGFIGMYLLLKKHLLPKETSPYIVTGTAVCFSLLPFWSFTMSVAGLPLVLYAFLNLRKKNTGIINWLIIILHGFYSSLVLTGVFFLIVMAFLFLRDIIKNKSINIPFLIGMALLSVIYTCSHLPLIISHFNENYISHRTEFQSVLEYPTKIMFKRISYLLQKGDSAYLGLSHAPSLHRFILIPVIIAIILMVKEKIKNKTFIYILLFIIVTSFMFGLLEWNDSAFIRNKLYSIFPLDLKRFYWLLPLCWYILMGLSLTIILKHIKWGKYIVSAFIIFQLGYIIKNQDYIESKKLPSYKEFYAQEQFNDIKQLIDKDQKIYRVISIGIHPAVSQYNGFYTLDGFSSDYPLTYKHKFGKIIETELEKNEEINKSFREWGSWCYAFSSELGLSPYIKYKEDFQAIEHLDFNYAALKSMGGDYIISAVEINTSNNPHLRLLNTYSKSNYKQGSTNWNIYLYEVLSKPLSFENNTGTGPIDNNT